MHAIAKTFFRIKKQKQKKTAASEMKKERKE
jgi:hypothetical protein